MRHSHCPSTKVLRIQRWVEECTTRFLDVSLPLWSFNIILPFSLGFYSCLPDTIGNIEQIGRESDNERRGGCRIVMLKTIKIATDPENVVSC